MIDVTDHYKGLLVTAPDHLAGSRVLSAHIDDDDGPEWNHDVELVLDRKHPTEAGYIWVTLDYVTLDMGEA